MYNVMKLTATNLPEILRPLQNDPSAVMWIARLMKETAQEEQNFYVWLNINEDGSASPMGMFPETAVESQPEKFNIVYIFTN